MALYRTVHVAGRLLNRHGIAWWAYGGTLLGAVRNKGIIPHDNDIDFATLDYDKLDSKELREDLRRNGYYLRFSTRVGRLKEAYVEPLKQSQLRDLQKKTQINVTYERSTLDIFPWE